MENIDTVIASLEMLITHPGYVEAFQNENDLQCLFSIYCSMRDRMKQDIKFYKFKHLREAQYYQAKYLLYPSFIDKVEIKPIDDETNFRIALQKHREFIPWMYDEFKNIKHNLIMIDKYGSNMRRLWNEIIQLRDIDIKRTFNKIYESCEKEIINTNEENLITDEF